MGKGDGTSLGDRMKGYEKIPSGQLTKRMPLIVRLDGKAFHTFTSKFNKPCDKDLSEIMIHTTKYLVDNIMGCKLGYCQSDEISLLITDYDKLETQPWYGKAIQKIVSVSASMATARFNSLYQKVLIDKRTSDYALFDSRAFVLPKEEVNNYFLWRQRDCTRNSIQGLGQVHFPHKDLQGKSGDQIKGMLKSQKNINWNHVSSYFKLGGCVSHDRGIDWEIPVFSQDTQYIRRYVYTPEIRHDEPHVWYIGDNGPTHKTCNPYYNDEMICECGFTYKQHFDIDDSRFDKMVPDEELPCSNFTPKKFEDVRHIDNVMERDIPTIEGNNMFMHSPYKIYLGDLLHNVEPEDLDNSELLLRIAKTNNRDFLLLNIKHSDRGVSSLCKYKLFLAEKCWSPSIIYA